MLIRIPYKINAPCSCAISQKFCCRKKDVGLCKIYSWKKEEKKKIVEKKIDKCTIYLKQWVLRWPLEKRDK
jgi:hypothetical protein